MSCLSALLALGLIAADPWSLQESGTNARLRGLSVEGRDVAWASGSRGTCLRTVDGGRTWEKRVVPDAEGLDFRDVQAFDDRRAFLLSIGPGELSRIYRTADAGATWTLSHRNRDPKGFLDALAFWDADRGLALGDPVDGRYVILSTTDGGTTWTPCPAEGMPEALPVEGAFAASGTCLVTQGTGHAWFATGGGATARVFRSTDGGRTWRVAPTPIRAGNPSSGIFSIAFRDPMNGVVVGGDYKSPDDPTANLAFTRDGGATWTALPEASRPSGFRSAVAFVPGRPRPTLVAVGPSGSDLSTDDGRTWSKGAGPGFDSLGFDPSGNGWASGEAGRLGRFDPAFLKGR